jgi:hypothetical protein
MKLLSRLHLGRQKNTPSLESVENIELVWPSADLERCLIETKLKIVNFFLDISSVAGMAWDHTDNHNIRAEETEWQLRAALNTIRSACDRIAGELDLVHAIVTDDFLGDRKEPNSLE